MSIYSEMSREDLIALLETEGTCPHGFPAGGYLNWNKSARMPCFPCKMDGRRAEEKARQDAWYAKHKQEKSHQSEIEDYERAMEIAEEAWDAAWQEATKTQWDRTQMVGAR